MAYDATVPNQANFVRGASGDLTKIRQNFQELNSYIAHAIKGGTPPSEVLSGFMFGNTEYRAVLSGTAWTLQRNDGSAGSPSWANQYVVPNSGRFQFPGEVQGATPTQADSLATKGYVDAASGALPRTFSGLDDTDMSSLASGDVPRFDGSNWLSTPYALGAMNNVEVSGVTSGQSLVYDPATSQWVPGEPGGTLETVREADGSPTLSGVTILTFSGEGSAAVAVASGVSGEAIVTVSAVDAVNGALFTTSGGDQAYAAGLRAISGLSGLAPPGTPASGDSYIGSLGVPLVYTGATLDELRVAVHVGASGDETDPEVYFDMFTYGPNHERHAGFAEFPIPLTSSGDLVTVSVSGADTFTVKADADQFAFLRMRDADAAAGAGGGGGSTTLSGLTDTAITAPASGAHLEWDGADWIDRGFVLRTVLAASGTEIAISGIPQGARHLQVRARLRVSGTTQGETCFVRFNGDSGANYDASLWFADAAASDSNGALDGAGLTRLPCGFATGDLSPANAWGYIYGEINEYAATDHHRLFTGRGFAKLDTGATDVNRTRFGGQWQDLSSGVESVTITNNTAKPFDVGSVLEVRGI
jgi:hypothetical protein